jgi:hypothetical protein
MGADLRRRSIQRGGVAAVWLALLLPAASLAAQTVCRPPAGSNEARTLAIFSVPLAFGPAAAPDAAAGVWVGLEGVYLPSVDPALATATICRPGKGPEHTDLLPALPRPRVGLALPLGLALEASWVPPVRVAGVRANLFGFALAKDFGRRDGLAGALRVHATVGSIRAPITCADAALSDPISECFHGTRSDDRYSPNILGADVSMGWPMAAGRLHPYLGAGYTRLEPRFQVNFTNQFGVVDNTRVEVNLDRVALFGGAAWQVAGGLGVVGEVYAVPADAVTARLVIRRTFGKPQ